MYTLQIRTANGKNVLKIDSNSTMKDFRQQIQNVTKIDVNRMKISSGYPPKILSNVSQSTTLKSAGISNMDVVNVDQTDEIIQFEKDFQQNTDNNNNNNNSIVNNQNAGQEKNSSTTNNNPDYFNVPTHHSTANILAPGKIDESGFILRRVVDADNSCLFNSFGYLLENRDKSVGPKLRSLIGRVILANPQKYNQSILDNKTPNEYVDWLSKSTSWGGAIEVEILSHYYQTETVVFDISNQRFEIFGRNSENKSQFKRRILLIWDGIHYDPLVFSFLPPSENPPEEMDVSQFSVNDEIVLEKGLEFTKKQHNAGTFTDLQKFTLRCLVCQKGLTGQDEAVKHARETTHQNFSQF